ncbi:MAG: hypothetical protein IPL65_12585 [Lewinellaceae bacterium]|nr:hypothetical protein [Lewinellaceae bacterium]
MIKNIPPRIISCFHSQTRNLTNRLVGGLFALVVVLIMAVACKGDVKGTDNAKDELAAAITTSDSMFSQLYSVQQEFHQLKADMDAAPETLKATPEFQQLQQRVEGAIIKSGVFFDDISKAKESASTGLQALLQSENNTATGLDSIMAAVNKYVGDNQENYQQFLKVAADLRTQYDQIKAGASK